MIYRPTLKISNIMKQKLGCTAADYSIYESQRLLKRPFARLKRIVSVRFIQFLATVLPSFFVITNKLS